VTQSGPTTVILIHGNGGCTAGDIWFPWLERECAALGLRVINQTFPDNVKARARFWLPHLEQLGADENTILIGHSSGAVAAMRYAETHRLFGSILVGVCHTDLGDSGEAESGYYSAPWQWERIRDNQRWIAIYQSSDRGATLRREAIEVQLLRARGSRPFHERARLPRSPAVPQKESPLVIDAG
jgi:pimeloyl-ACP methyl ester carboxylesterase